MFSTVLWSFEAFGPGRLSHGKAETKGPKDLKASQELKFDLIKGSGFRLQALKTRKSPARPTPQGSKCKNNAAKLLLPKEDRSLFSSNAWPALFRDTNLFNSLLKHMAQTENMHTFKSFLSEPKWELKKTRATYKLTRVNFSPCHMFLKATCYMQYTIQHRSAANKTSHIKYLVPTRSQKIICILRLLNIMHIHVTSRNQQSLCFRSLSK